MSNPVGNKEVNERPLAEQLAREVLRDPATQGWLAPLAREYLKAIAAADEQDEASHD
jgi:hypothetical protein